MTFYLSLEGNDPFWKRKPQDKPAKPQDKPVRAPRVKTKVTKRPSKKIIAESPDPAEDVDDLESDVEIDSLGSFFMHLIDNDHYQDDAEASRVNHVEVISLSSNSDHVPVPKLRRVVRKVKRSHPPAHLDPHFSLKTQQHEARRTTRHSGHQVTSSGLPDTPVRKHHPKVSCSSNKSYPLVGCFRYPFNLSDLNYQGTSNSSFGDSSTTQMPPLKTVPR